MRKLGFWFISAYIVFWHHYSSREHKSGLQSTCGNISVLFPSGNPHNLSTQSKSDLLPPVPVCSQSSFRSLRSFRSFASSLVLFWWHAVQRVCRFCRPHRPPPRHTGTTWSACHREPSVTLEGDLISGASSWAVLCKNAMSNFEQWARTSFNYIYIINIWLGIVWLRALCSVWELVIESIEVVHVCKKLCTFHRSCARFTRPP